MPAVICAGAVLGACVEPGGGSPGSGPAIALPTDGGWERFDYPVEGVRLGQGWHRDFGEKSNVDCVAFRTERDLGQEQTMSISMTQDHNDTMSSMNVSAEVQVQSINYEVSGKASFANQLKTSTDSLSFVAYAEVKNGAAFAAPLHDDVSAVTAIRLSPHFESLARRRPSEFKRQCGDAFVAAIFSGAELVAQLTFEESSSDKREDIAASLEGSGWGVTASGSAESSMSTYASNGRLRIRYFQSGGSGNPIPVSQDEFQQAISRLPSLAETAPMPYEILVADYRALANFPGETETESNEFHEQLAVSYGRLLTLDHELADILEDEDGATWRWLLPPGETWETLRTLQDEIRQKRKELIGLAERCSFVAGDEVPASGLEAPCDWSDGYDYRNDYDLRIRMPIPSAGVTSPPTFTDANVRDCEHAQFQVINKENETLDGDATNVIELLDAVRLLRDICVGINPGQYPELYNAGIADEIVNYRVRDVSEARCRDNLRDPGCLTSEDVDGYASLVDERVAALGGE